jgi:hypothetical protein
MFGWNCDSKKMTTMTDLTNDSEIIKVITDSIEMALTLQVPTPEPALSRADFRATVTHVRKELEQLEQLEQLGHDSDSDSDSDSNDFGAGANTPAKKMWKIFRDAVNA